MSVVICLFIGITKDRIYVSINYLNIHVVVCCKYKVSCRYFKQPSSRKDVEHAGIFLFARNTEIETNVNFLLSS